MDIALLAAVACACTLAFGAERQRARRDRPTADRPADRNRKGAR